MNKREVLADMRAGRFVDPVCGRGFFCRAANSVRVSASAANAWRRSWFVPVVARVAGAGDSIPGHKKESVFPSLLQSAEDERRRELQTDLNGKNAPAKGRRVIRELSPGFLASNGSK